MYSNGKGNGFDFAVHSRILGLILKYEYEIEVLNFSIYFLVFALMRKTA